MNLLVSIDGMRMEVNCKTGEMWSNSNIDVIIMTMNFVKCVSCRKNEVKSLINCKLN